jgi:hypothetical protein
MPVRDSERPLSLAEAEQMTMNRDDIASVCFQELEIRG